MKILKCITLLIILLSNIASAQWSPLQRISYARGGHKPQIIAAGDTLHAVYEGLTSYDRTVIWYVKSTDAGDNWSTPQIISDTTGTNSVASPRITSLGNTTIIFWRQNFRDSLLRDNIGYRLSSDGGVTWLGSHYLLRPNLDYLGYYDVSSSDSIINVVYAHQDGSYTYHFSSLRSMNFGRSWSQPSEILQATDFGLLDMVSYSQVINVVWTGNFALSNTWEVFHFRSSDGGLTWGINDTLSAFDGECSQFPKLSADETGGLYLVWQDHKDSPYMMSGDAFERQSTDGGVSWSPEEQITFNHTVEEPELVAHNDSVFVAWVDMRFGNNLNVYSILITNKGLTRSDEERMEPDDYYCVDPSLAYSDGHAYMVFRDSRCEPDTDICGGGFFTKFPAEPDRVIDNQGIFPAGISLGAYPNPFNSNVLISYLLPDMRGGELGIYDIQGQLVKRIHLDSKEGKIIWDASDAQGNKLSSGVYFAKASAPGRYICFKMVLLR